MTLKRLLTVTVSLAITGLLVWTLRRELAGHSLAEVFGGIDRRLLLSYAGLSLASLFVRALRYRHIFGKIHPRAEAPAFADMMILTAIRNVLVDILPMRMGELGYVYVARQARLAYSAIISTFGISILMDILTLALLASGVLLSMIDGGARAALILLFVFGALLAALFWADKILISLAYRLRRRLSKKLRRFARETAQELHLLRKRRALFSTFMLTVALRVLKYSSLYLLLLAVMAHWNLGRADIPPAPGFISFVVAESAASLPVSGLLGFGAYEGSWAGVMKVLGIMLPSPVVAIFSIHLITQLLGYCIGFLGICAFLLRSRIK